MTSVTRPLNVRARVGIVVLASAAVAVGYPGISNAAASDELFGQHVSECAQANLGPRIAPPAVTCSHGFANFGSMVRHMREHSTA